MVELLVELKARRVIKMEKEKSFEEKLSRLETITNEIEDQNLSLQKALEVYEEGSKLIKELEQELTDAMKKFENERQNKLK